jgi:hypothetical protein
MKAAALLRLPILKRRNAARTTFLVTRIKEAIRTSGNTLPALLRVVLGIGSIHLHAVENHVLFCHMLAHGATAM